MRVAGLMVMLSIAVVACGGATQTPPPAATEPPSVATEPPAAGFQIPDIVDGKFNVAVVLIGFHADGGWSQAHLEGAQWMSTQDDSVNVQYVELINPGPDAESVMRSLARKGFDLILGTTFEYGETMEALAAEFPAVNWVHVSGYRSNGTNYGNLFGAMEDMKYLAGMIAGARAMADGNTKLGYVAPWPLPEVIRLGNAFMRGAKTTCPECTLDVNWIFTWYDPDKENQAGQSLLDSGVGVVLIGSDTPGPLVAAANAGKWAFTYDYVNSCSPAPDQCLGTPYWNWGPVYLDIVNQIRAGTWVPGNSYLDADTGIVGLYGFMEGQTPQPGVPADVIAAVQAKLAEMLAGTFTRFDVFAGPIIDNTGTEILPAGQTLSQEDLEGIDAGTISFFNLTDRTACTVCMNWLNEGVQGTIPPMP
jgi:basic membrane protein A